ncbi:hypothetical protein F4779DRAFT_563657 [Xylariaceae sp. FL0662B]|nr:hypothetical protein F4779DRAFT_563657 [Xylariaceae sp. FL0662B]
MQPSNAVDSPTKVQLNGLFRNSIWHCNCSPRLPAVQFQVKKDTPNRGRSFYTCQKERGKGNKCDFFLWTEDARAREMGAVLSNSRSEAETPSRKPKRQTTLHESITPSKEKRPWYEKTPVTSLADLNRGIFTGSTATAESSTMKASPSGGPVEELNDDISSDEEDELVHIADANSQPRASPETPSAGSKRKQPDVEEYSDFSSGDEEELAAMADSTGQSLGSQSKYRNAFETSAADRTHLADDGMPTPLTGKPVRRVLFADPEVRNSKRQRTDENIASLSQVTTAVSPFSTPSSSQGDAATPSKASTTITQEVMALLKDQKVDEQVLHNIRVTLDKHAAKARGLERGRDASRDAAKKAEGRIAELQQRITDLENQRKMDAEARKKMRTDLMKVYCDN